MRVEMRRYMLLVAQTTRDWFISSVVKNEFQRAQKICLYLISITVLALTQRKQYLECW